MRQILFENYQAHLGSRRRYAIYSISCELLLYRYVCLNASSIGSFQALPSARGIHRFPELFSRLKWIAGWRAESSSAPFFRLYALGDLPGIDQSDSGDGLEIPHVSRRQGETMT